MKAKRKLAKYGLEECRFRYGSQLNYQALYEPSEPSPSAENQTKSEILANIAAEPLDQTVAKDIGIPYHTADKPKNTAAHEPRAATKTNETPASEPEKAIAAHHEPGKATKATTSPYKLH